MIHPLRNVVMASRLRATHSFILFRSRLEKTFWELSPEVKHVIFCPYFSQEFICSNSTWLALELLDTCRVPDFSLPREVNYTLTERPS